MCSRPPQTMGNILEISVARRKCLCVAGKVVLWSTHFDIRILVPMFFLKLSKNIYIYMCIYISIIQLLRNLYPFFGNMTCSKKIILSASKIWFFRSRTWLLPRKIIICFENMICSFGDMPFFKKVNYLLRKYDLFVQKHDLFKEN